MPATTFLNNIALDLVLGGTAYPSKPSTLYFALFTDSPTASGGGAEVAGSGYARKAVTANTTNFPLIATAGLNMTLATDIQWPLSTGDWGTVVAWGIYDAATAGNLMFYSALTSHVLMTTGMRPKIAASALVLSMSGQFGNMIERRLLNHIFSAESWPGFATHYFAVGTGISLNALSGEAVNGSYARKSMTNNKTTYGVAANGRLVNTAAVAFASATASWSGSNFEYWAIYDAASSGNCLWYGSIGTPVAISSGVYQWIAGELVMSLT